MKNERLVKIIKELKRVRQSLSIQHTKSNGLYAITDYLSDVSSIDNTILVLQEECRKNNRQKYNAWGGKYGK